MTTGTPCSGPRGPVAVKFRIERGRDLQHLRVHRDEGVVVVLVPRDPVQEGLRELGDGVAAGDSEVVADPARR